MTNYVLSSLPPEEVFVHVQSRRLAPLLILALVVAVASPAHAADPADERDDVRTQQEENERELDVLRASEAEVVAALGRLERDLAAAEAELVEAERAVAEAEARITRLDEDLADLADERDALQGQLEEAAVQAYVRGGSTDGAVGLGDGDPNDAVVRHALIGVTQGDLNDLLESLRATEARQQEAREAATAAREDAATARDDAAAELSSVEAAAAEQQALAGQVENRINEALSESAALEGLDAQLSAEIREQQQQLVESLPPPPPPPTSEPPQPDPDDDDDGTSNPPTTSPPTTGPPTPPTPPPTVPAPPGGIVTVRGIQVASSIAGPLESMLASAEAAGIVLGGRGYRDPAEQIALRQQNCGTSYYAIWQMPPTQCSPETAIPGTSKHERGLAIDFAVNGMAIQSTGSREFQWLAANAGGFGFVNLPGEPWHWSMGGG